MVPRTSRGELRRFFGGPGSQDVQAVPFGRIEVGTVGLDDVELVDPGLLVVGGGEVRRSVVAAAGAVSRKSRA